MGKFAVVSTILLMLGSATRAQDPVPQLPTGQDPGRRVFRSEASVVALNVTVTATTLITGFPAALGMAALETVLA